MCEVDDTLFQLYLCLRLGMGLEEGEDVGGGCAWVGGGGRNGGECVACVLCDVDAVQLGLLG